MEQISNFLFSDGGYSPHGYCIAWNAPVLYTHIIADLLIALSYFAIPAVMLVFLRQRRDPRLHLPAMLFVVFITACGVSHLMSIVTMYLPYYGLQGMLKLFTGVVSLITAIALWKMLPDALKIPSPDMLMKALDDKDREIRDRTAAQLRLEDSQRQLDQKIAELQASNEELREFAYAASHDLKAPANTLSLWLQDFEQESGDSLSAEQREDLEHAKGILKRMRSLVDDILSYARVVNTEDAVIEEVDVTEIFTTAAKTLRPDIEQARGKIVIADMPSVEGYPALMSMLAHNLLSNAIKFRSPDRPLKVEVAAWHEASAEPQMVISVKDNGIGINAAYHRRIFKLFKKLHRPEDYEGTGLGLALCRRLAVTHGGSIDVISEEGHGAEFRVSFPMEVAHVAKAA
jgi:signal transduction histidine kinase